MEYLLDWAYKNDVNYLRLKPKPPGFKKINDDINELTKYSIYRTSLFFVVWRRELFIEILNQYQDPWSFEVLGTYHYRNYEKFYVVNKDFINFVHILAKDKWIVSNIQKIEVEESILEKKQKMNYFIEKKWLIKKNILKFYEKVPDTFLKFKLYYFFKNIN